MNPAQEKRLLRESAWMRIFGVKGEDTIIYESKFLVDGLHLSPADVRKMWSQLSLEQQIEFASAFSTQPPRHLDDHGILEFLLETGPEPVWRGIAILLPFHRNRARAVSFLSERLKQSPLQRANYYQAAESLHAQEITDIMHLHFHEYRTTFESDPEASRDLRRWIDYLQCCKTLFALTQDPQFSAALDQGVSRAPKELRGFIPG